MKSCLNKAEMIVKYFPKAVTKPSLQASHFNLLFVKAYLRGKLLSSASIASRIINRGLVILQEVGATPSSLRAPNYL